MHLRNYTIIIFTQIPSADFPTRNKVYSLNKCHKYETDKGWENLTDSCTITIPKNIRVQTGTTKTQYDVWNNINVFIGGQNALNPPLFMRGDMVKMYSGYRYFDNLGNEQTSGFTIPIFTGYITEIGSKMPMTLQVEDHMWRLKQIPVQNRQWVLNGKYTVQTMIQEMLKAEVLKPGYPELTVNTRALTSVTFNTGSFVTEQETVAQVLARVRRDLHLEAYFRDTELRIGFPVYLEDEANKYTFAFQKNIIDDELIYRRKDDVVLSAIVTAIYNAGKGTTKDGHAKTKKKRLEVLVYQPTAGGDFKYLWRSEGHDIKFPENVQGERRTIFYAGTGNPNDPTELFNYGVQELKKYYYSGFHGSFTTFGMPRVKHGDNIVIQDPILPDRNGTYKVRHTKDIGDTSNGERQKITLDYLII